MMFDFTKAQLVTVNLVVPLAIWLMLVSFLAVIVLLLGYGPG